MENIVGERKTIFISAMGRKAKGTGAAASRAGGGRFSAEASNQISLMKWIKITEAGRAGSHGHPVLGSLKPPPCGFSLLFRPFHK